VALELVIVTPEGQAFEGIVDQVVLPGSEGDFGVLEQHERFLAPLKHGPVEIKTSSGSEWAAISNGFADVSAEKVVVLADYCALADTIDAAMARQEETELLHELAALPEIQENESRRAALQDQILKAQILLEVSGKG
jgi:F-type H+-transporting ATPase subunit epsilon